MSGFITILLAALVWGIGNAITGYTAHRYLAAHSLLPGVEIALANTLGGLLFLLVAHLVNLLSTSSQGLALPKCDAPGETTKPRARSLLAGFFKGLNTCLFVFSTTYVAATQSLVLESTYVAWSLLFAIVFAFRSKANGIAGMIGKTALLLVGAFLVSGRANLELTTSEHFVGSLCGVGAGLTYALFLLLWGRVTSNLSNLGQQIAATARLLLLSFLSILILTELLAVLLFSKWWVPFSVVKTSDIVVQLVNGVFVVGVTYLLITVGMARLRTTAENAQYLVALGLSFSIPFTLLAELMIGRFLPAPQQVAGLILFMVAFVVLSATPTDKRLASSAKEERPT